MSRNTLKVFKALADQTRIKIVKKLIDYDEVSCRELMKHFPLSQPTLSHHFSKLLDKRRIIPREVKNEVLAKAKSGERVALLATQYGMSDKTICRLCTVS